MCTDMMIEQSLMEDMKSIDAVTHGREVYDSVLSWCVFVYLPAVN